MVIFGGNLPKKATISHGLVILAVEDHRMFSKNLLHLLPGHKVVLARNVEEAKDCYEKNLPDLIFLDIDLPDGTGFEVLDYIKEREPDAYVVMITGSKIESDVMASHKKGVEGYIVKPFAKSRLDQHLRHFIEHQEAKAGSPAHPPGTPGPINPHLPRG